MNNCKANILVTMAKVKEGIARCLGRPLHPGRSWLILTPSFPPGVTHCIPNFIITFLDFFHVITTFIYIPNNYDLVVLVSELCTNELMLFMFFLASLRSLNSTFVSCRHAIAPSCSYFPFTDYNVP